MRLPPIPGWTRRGQIFSGPDGARVRLAVTTTYLEAQGWLGGWYEYPWRAQLALGPDALSRLLENTFLPAYLRAYLLWQQQK